VSVICFVFVRALLQAVPCIVLGDERNEHLHRSVAQFPIRVVNNVKHLFVGQRSVDSRKLVLQLFSHGIDLRVLELVDRRTRLRFVIFHWRSSSIGISGDTA
jgi:hypothetical protein